MNAAADAKHTLGPWRVACPPNKICTDYRGEAGEMLPSNYGNGGYAKTVAVCESRSWMDDGEEFANARLIAAAPDLLEALKGSLLSFKCTQKPEQYPDDHWCNKAIRAIAKAEGRSQEERG